MRKRLLNSPVFDYTAFDKDLNPSFDIDEYRNKENRI